jgi:hypothetical protein
MEYLQQLPLLLVEQELLTLQTHLSYSETGTPYHSDTSVLVEQELLTIQTHLRTGTP